MKGPKIEFEPYTYQTVTLPNLLLKLYVSIYLFRSFNENVTLKFEM